MYVFGYGFMFIPYKFFDRFFSKFLKNPDVAIFNKVSAFAAVIVSVVILSLKLIAIHYTKSLTIEASALDSFMDTIASLLAFFAIGYSVKKADKNHGYGHGKIEGLAALAQMCFILLACGNIFVESYENFKNPTQIEHQSIGICVMLISSVLVYLLVSLQLFSSHKTKSMIVKSDSLHYSADLFMNFGVMLSIILSNSIKYIDCCVGVAVGIYVFVNAIKICKRSVSDLMDSELPQKYRDQVLDKLKQDKRIRKILRVRTRSSGTKKIVHADIELDRNLSLVESAKISLEIERNVAALFLDCEVLIVAYPEDEKK